MKVAFDVRTNALVYDHVDPLKIARAVPEARRLHNGYVALRASLANMQALTLHGLPVPSPLKDYDWPSKPGLRPMEVQRHTAAFLALNPRAFVLSEMRTGKTLSSLWAADYIMREAPGTKCLIVANLSTLQRTWAKEIFENFLGRRTYAVCHGSDDARQRELARDVDFYVVNHDGVGVGASFDRRGGLQLRGFAAALSSRDDIKIVIVDEASAYREAGTRRHRVARQFLAPREYLWQMTGTPTPNAPTDAYGLAKLRNNAFGESFRSFQNRTMVQITQFKWVPRPGSDKLVSQMLSPAIRFTQEDCFDAPPETIEDRDAQLSDEQTKLLKDLRREAALTLKSGAQITAVNEASIRTKLLQISCGAIYDAEHDSHRIDAGPRMKLLKEIIAEAPRKVIVFAPLTNAINAIKMELDTLGITSVVANGSVSNKDRDEALRQFQTEEHPRVLVAHPGPIARGLDLTAAATIIWYCPTDKTEEFQQACQRINGPAQKYPRHIIRISATSVEREIYKRLQRNETLQGIFLKLVQDGGGDL